MAPRRFLLLVIAALALSASLGAVQQADPPADPPKVKTFVVNGEVRRGGEKPWDEKMTVGRAIDLAGGMTDKGSLGRSHIQRKKSDGSNETIRSLNLETSILAGDTLVIGRKLF